MERRRFRSALLEITLAPRLGELLTQWAGHFASGRGPVQAILPTLGADELLSVLQQRISLGIANVVLALPIDESEGGLNSRELIRANAPIQHLLRARLTVESPTSITLNDRKRKRPLVLPDFERGKAFDTRIERVCLCV